ncbi:YbaN family protein [Pseudomonas spirodelae]|uniref:Inner membrane protein n=1 Tax=Pseudomonas spirodelae TaxID=3101751 RepID=A0ABU5P6R4_9PSED|nr:YbaN family protein [Pseudomonas sp. T5W1]MBU0807344.1 YbaN family protein [Gammaproteobacteria bacterium]MBU0884915.1 YbaN family protein [Gammaproteobacteria bacterium]MBU0901163.1 YbaN family protein [Gammaproteobacteria bacterium]MBU1859535.1 YbaN family protein [Gammaproteobacteria bacterium]MEA1605352.1 YbaN family protein [Pseudomonas sp. T5W1]
MARDIQLQRNPAIRYALLAIGWLSVALGVIGIFLPVLPTTPFLLLAAACFMRSSKRFYLWLVNHRKLGPWIVDYLEGQGIPLKGKVYAISLMWLSIGLSCYLVPLFWARAFMLTSAVLVSLYILRQKTLSKR